MMNMDLEKIVKMSKKSYHMMEELAKASGSKTVNLVINHELENVSPYMIDWWWGNIKDMEQYKLWHPEDHILFEWEIIPEKGQFGIPLI